MKNFCSRFCRIAFAGLALVAAVVGRGADTLHMDTVTTVDALGDGEMTTTFRLSASQWTVWKQQYGDRPDVLWRDFKQRLAAYALDKFSFEKNDVERIATAKITMRAAASLRTDGSRQIDVPKEMKLISGSNREWIFSSVSQESPYAPIINQTNRLFLPTEATNVRLLQPGTAFQAIAYEMPGTAGRSTGVLIAGIVALILGAALAVMGFLPQKSVPAPVTA